MIWATSGRPPKEWRWPLLFWWSSGGIFDRNYGEFNRIDRREERGSRSGTQAEACDPIGLGTKNTKMVLCRFRSPDPARELFVGRPLAPGPIDVDEMTFTDVAARQSLNIRKPHAVCGVVAVARYCAKYPLVSRIRWVWSVEKALSQPACAPKPSGTNAALAVMLPSRAFSVDTTGCAVPLDHNVR